MRKIIIITPTLRSNPTPIYHLNCLEKQTFSSWPKGFVFKEFCANRKNLVAAEKAFKRLIKETPLKVEDAEEIQTTGKPKVVSCQETRVQRMKPSAQSMIQRFFECVVDPEIGPYRENFLPPNIHSQKNSDHVTSCVVRMLPHSFVVFLTLIAAGLSEEWPSKYSTLTNSIVMLTILS